jgi:MULE transposase domain
MVMHNKHKKLFNLNHELIDLDFTYKINRFNMPLLNIVGIALTNKSFFGTSYFLPKETDKNFAWCFERLKLNCYLRDIPSPKIFFMDADPAQIRTFKQVFPDAVILLCV